MGFSVKQARQYAGFTQREMAEKLSISRDSYRKIEKNPETATISLATKFSQVTGIPIDQIFLLRTLLKVVIWAERKGGPMENKKAAPVCETGAAGNPASEWKEMTLQDAVDMLLDMRFCVEFDFDAPKNLRKRYASVRRSLWSIVFKNLPQLDFDGLTDGRFTVIGKEPDDSFSAL